MKLHKLNEYLKFYCKRLRNATITQPSNKNLSEKGVTTNTLMCCQTCALQVDYLKIRSENDKGTE